MICPRGQLEILDIALVDDHDLARDLMTVENGAHRRYGEYWAVTGAENQRRGDRTIASSTLRGHDVFDLLTRIQRHATISS
jgi:hypothetical protein